MEGCFKPLSQMESLELPRLSSFNIAKMTQTAKLNYTLEEAMGSPAAMLEILDSLPDETEGLLTSGGAMDEDRRRLLKARQDLKTDVRQSLIILDDVTRKMVEMSGRPLPDPMKQPLKVATQSTIEKLPPITINQYLTTAPLEWGNEKKNSGSPSDGDSASPHAKKAMAMDEVVKDGVMVATKKKCTTYGRDDVVSASVVATTTAEKAATEKAAAEKAAAEKVAAAKAAAAKAAVAKAAAEKAAAAKAAAEKAAAKKAATEKAAAEKAAAAKVAAEKAAAEKVAAEKAAAEMAAAEMAAAEKAAAEKAAAEKEAAEKEAAEKAAAEKAAAEKAAAEKAAAEKAAAEKRAAEKAARKAEIQTKITELERAMQVEMQKLKQIDEEPDTTLVESEVEKMKVKHEKKMAEYMQVIESAKEQRIAQAEVAMKERQEAVRIAQAEAAMKKRQEAVRIAEMERAQQEMMKANKLAKHRQTKMEANSEAEKLRKRAEYDQKMAEFDRMIQNSKDHKIAQVKAAIKERQEALKIAELERAQQEAKLAKERQATQEAET